MLRFSHCVVPVGKVAVHGHGADGEIVAFEGQHGADHIRTKSGASAGTIGRRVIVEVAFSGTLTSNRFSMVASTAAKFCFTTASPRLP